MTFVPAADTWAVTLRFTATGLRPKTMNFHVLNNGGTMSSVGANLLAAAIESWAESTYDATYGTGLNLSNIQVRDASQQNGVVVDFNTDIPGTIADNGLPGNVAFAISLRTGLAGKSFRGRMYHPWLGEADVTGNSLSSTRADAIRDAWTALDAALQPSDWLISVVSKYSNGAPRVNALVTPIVGFTYTDLNVDTQRRHESANFMGDGVAGTQIT